MSTVEDSFDLADELAAMLNLFQGVPLIIERADKVIIHLGQPNTFSLLNKLLSHKITVLIIQHLLIVSGAFTFTIYEVEAEMLQLMRWHPFDCPFYNSRCVLLLGHLNKIHRDERVDLELVIVNQMEDFLDDKVTEFMVHKLFQF
jgi:hypothetical protein